VHPDASDQDDNQRYIEVDNGNPHGLMSYPAWLTELLRREIRTNLLLYFYYLIFKLQRATISSGAPPPTLANYQPSRLCLTSRCPFICRHPTCLRPLVSSIATPTFSCIIPGTVLLCTVLPATTLSCVISNHVLLRPILSTALLFPNVGVRYI
jgi:hypothetical protein